MATRNIISTARTANKDVRMRFYHDGSAFHVRVELDCDLNSGAQATVEYDVAISASTLSAAQKTALQSALLSLRDEALIQLGFV